MKKTMIRLAIILALAAQLTLFAPTTKAAVSVHTSKCTGTVTLTGRLGTITKAISFILIGSFTGPFSFSYSTVINGFTYSASAGGTCVAN